MHGDGQAFQKYQKLCYNFYSTFTFPYLIQIFLEKLKSICLFHPKQSKFAKKLNQIGILPLIGGSYSQEVPFLQAGI